MNKHAIFDLFYSPQDVTRSGGGKVKTKMTRNNVPLASLKKIEQYIEDPKLKSYYEKLRDRPCNIAPPPRPK